MEDLICSICLENFDATIKVPLVLGCGHTLCRQCLQQYNSKAFLCPVDRKQEWRNINTLPKNFIILELLLPRKETEKCLIHKKKLKWVCEVDNVNLCSECILAHNGHFLKRFESMSEDPKMPEIIVQPKLMNHSIFGSKILPHGSINVLRSIILPNKVSLNSTQLIYSLINNGASNEEFHKLCDNKGATVTLIELMDGHIFGGFTSVSWNKQVNERGNNIRDDKAFLFSISNPKDSHQLSLKTECRGLAVYHHHNCGPVFGVGYDIYINFDNLAESYTWLESYSSSKGHTYRAYLAGRFNNWEFKEIEIYRIL